MTERIRKTTSALFHALGVAGLCFALGLQGSADAQAQDIITLTGNGVQTTPGSPAQPPDVYTVQVGDTLWDISSKFLGNPYYWPRLWSINDYITNPHWIYPGNRIIFIPGTEIEPPSMALEGEDGYVREGYSTPSVAFEEGDFQCGPDIHFNTTTARRRLRAAAYLEDRDKLETLGTLEKARTGHHFLGKWHLVYLKMDDSDSIDCGDVFSIYRKVVKKVRHPEARIRYGSLYWVIAEARVLHVQDDVAMAVIRDSYYEAQRGDIVGPRIPINVELEFQVPKGSLEGVVVARAKMEENMLAASEEVVFLDRGRSDGVRVGNSFYVVERRDEYLEADKDDAELPPSVIGRIVVVRVDESSSTGVIVDAARQIDIGARVTMLVE